MDIVPIIYTILFVVIALAFIVISYSYFKFNKNQKNAKSTPEEISQVRTIKPVQQIHRNDIVLAPKKKIEQKAKKTTEKQKLKKIAVGSDQKKDTKKVFKSNKRVKIINLETKELNKKQFTKTGQITKSGKNLESLEANLNILDKYSDENAGDLYSIKVGEDKNKSKTK